MTQRQPKVLIADDATTIHELIRSALPPDYSSHTIHAFDGEECLLALDHGVDLAFIDVLMPRMRGSDALWAARIAGNKTFVTLISGRSTKRCVELARRLDAYEFLIKPFSKADIDAIMQTYQRISNPMDVLLVDDSQVLLKSMRKVLANSIFHLNIEEVNTGRKAIARCGQKAFDFIILDVNMPGLDGYQTLARLIQNHPQAKVIMISGEHNSLQERTAFKLGAAALLRKPFFPTEIDAVLHRLFDLQSPRLATDGQIRDFGIKIHGRTIAVEHTTTGHVYEYVWFREPPHLRFSLIKRNEEAEISAEALTSHAKKAALLELANASLLGRNAHQHLIN